MESPQADALIITLERGGSLSAWRSNGVFQRECKLLYALAEHYPTLIIVSHGGQDEQALTERLIEDGPEGCAIHVICRPTRPGEASVTDMVLTLLPKATTVIVQTEQFDDAGLAESIVGPLRHTGRRVGFVARAGRLTSKLLSLDAGPHSAEAIEAGLIEESICRAAQIVVGSSQEMIDDLAWRLSIDPKRTRVVPHFVLDDKPAGDIDERDHGLLLACGPLTAQRRIDLIIRAIGKLPDAQRDELRLEISGDGPQRAALEALAEEEGINATFLGSIDYDDLMERMRVCGLFLFAGEGDTRPRSVLEAMAAGATVVLADWGGGTPIENGVSGLKAPASPEPIAHAIGGVLADEGWRELLGLSAARMIRARSGLSTVVKSLLGAHRDALSASMRQQRVA